MGLNSGGGPIWIRPGLRPKQQRFGTVCMGGSSFPRSSLRTPRSSLQCRRPVVPAFRRRLPRRRSLGGRVFPMSSLRFPGSSLRGRRPVVPAFRRRLPHRLDSEQVSRPSRVVTLNFRASDVLLFSKYLVLEQKLNLGLLPLERMLKIRTATLTGPLNEG